MTTSSGPPYPLQGPSSAIGSFVIGQSPIGDQSIFNAWTTIISQYANSSKIAQLCTNMGQYVDPTRDMDAFFDTIWNVDTAVGYGLDVWGRIVGVGRVLQVPPGTYLGFEEANSWVPFGQGPLFSGFVSTNNYTLTDDAYRTLILARALSNICDGSIPALNQLLLNLFSGSGICYVTDGLNMTMTYTFQFILTPVQLAIVTNSGVLPRTAGVSATVVQA